MKTKTQTNTERNYFYPNCGCESEAECEPCPNCGMCTSTVECCVCGVSLLEVDEGLYYDPHHETLGG